MTKTMKYHKLYMDIATKISEMSYAERAKVGCCIVKDNNIISFGWNGTPSGFTNGCEDCDGKTRPEVIHAEMNAFAKLLKNGNQPIAGSTIYLTLSPCYDCAKLIVQSGISKVIFLTEYRITDSIKFLVDANIEVYRYEENGLKQYF